MTKCRGESLALLVAFWMIGALASSAQANDAALTWPRQWVVFAPLDRDDEVADTAQLASIPDTLHTVSVSTDPAVDGTHKQTKAARLEVEPGKPADLIEFFNEQAVGNAAYVFIEIESPRAQQITLGAGADWWMEIWLNGEPVFDTMDRQGNRVSPINVTNHTFEASLSEGVNVLAVRFVTGVSSSRLAIGGPREIAAEERRLAREAAQNLNLLPEAFEDRMIFPEDRQALIMAERGLPLPTTDSDLTTGALVGLQPMPERQTFLEGSGRLADNRDTLNPRFDEPVKIRLSKYRYPSEDQHLDAIVWTTPEEEDQVLRGHLEVQLRDGEGEVLATHQIDELSPSGLFFSVGFPESLRGRAASLHVTWHQDSELAGESEAAFHVNEPAAVADSGRIPLRVLNEPGATVSNAPMTLGVPFPRGALHDETNVRLVDEAGEELPLQTRVSGKWSRFGPIKWLLCDFTVDLEGQPREVYLEYGSDVRRTERAVMMVESEAHGFPALDAGRIRVSKEGVGFDGRPVLDLAALRGEFVHHENGRTYVVPADIEHAIEELGSEKAVVRRTGWYVDEASGEPFCNFVTRLVFHRDSPVVRIFHTWIFTGDGNHDRIADMGWRFSTAASVSEGGFLSSFDDGDWLSGESLVQFDYQQFVLTPGDERHDGRTPGVLSATVNNQRVSFAVKDFWQNFPSELEITSDSFTFYNWPHRNPPASFDRPVARDDAFRHRYAHEGELLDFRMPEEYAQGEIWREGTRNGNPWELHWAEGKPESVNAQGIARTEEMFLYFADDSTTADEAAAVLRGLNDESLRAVVDPQWIKTTDVFGPIHPYDPERFPEVERIYELTMKAPPKWVERLGVYGMWLHGDYPTWNMNLSNRTVSTYRTFRKAHHQYPLKWMPFVRSGDPEYFKLAENATRQMVDANFCHFATAEVDATVGSDHYRRQGWWERNLFPWAGRRGPRLRSYVVDSDYLWQTYYLTGFARARDVALLFGELTQHDFRHFEGARTSQGLLASYLEMYQATFDPWFLSSSHELAHLHQEHYGDEVVDPFTPMPRGNGNRREFWRVADQLFYEFTGSDVHEFVARNSAIAYASPNRSTAGLAYSGDGGAARDLTTYYAWKRTGDPMYLQRLVAQLDYLKYMAYEGGIDYLRGLPHEGHGRAPTGRDLGIPLAMSVLAEYEDWPDPLHDPVLLVGEWINYDDDELHHFLMPEIFIRKDADTSFELSFNAHGQGARGDRNRPFDYEILGPDNLHLTGSGNAPEQIQIPGHAGTYRINISGAVPYPEGREPDWFHRRVARWYFPLTLPEIPEVIHFPPDDDGIGVQATAQGYWFFVPEDAQEFWIEFRSGRRNSVWDPDGKRVWDHSATGGEPSPDIARIVVPAEHRGRLWRATGGSFTIDPQIPPYFSTTRSKWFAPANARPRREPR